MQDDDKIKVQNTDEIANSVGELDKKIQEEVSKLEKQYGAERQVEENKSSGRGGYSEENSIIKKIAELEKESGIVNTEIKSKEDEVKKRLAEIQSEIKRLNELKAISQKISDKETRLKELDEMEKKIKEETDSLREEAENRLSQKANTGVVGIIPIIFGVIFMMSQVFLFTPKVQAQLGQYDITITTNPTNPGPDEEVTISVSSIVEDLDRDLIFWSIDGKDLGSGIGKKTILVNTKGIGEISIVRVKINLNNGNIEEKNITIYPAGVDIFWEGADSYSPPFYKGRNLPSIEGMIRVVAIPFINKNGVSSMGGGDFIYQWSKNLKPIPNASGYGRSSFNFKSSLLEEIERVGVSVSQIENQKSAVGQSRIIPGKPFILFYEKDSDLGIKYEQALSSLNISGRIANIVAEPFFFSVKNPLDKDLKYEWKINDIFTSPQGDRNKISIAPGVGGGSASINLNVESRSKLFQSKESSLTVFLNEQ